jgi:hypothetical protein
MCKAMHERANALPHAGVDQVRAECRYRVNAEPQDRATSSARTSATGGSPLDDRTRAFSGDVQPEVMPESLRTA